MGVGGDWGVGGGEGKGWGGGGGSGTSSQVFFFFVVLVSFKRTVFFSREGCSTTCGCPYRVFKVSRSGFVWGGVCCGSRVRGGGGATRVKGGRRWGEVRVGVSLTT